MFSLNFKNTGWLNRYLLFRLKSPFLLKRTYSEFAEGDLRTENFDKCLYTLVTRNGILYGCPIISPFLSKLSKKLNFPKQQGGTILIFLETLFSVALIENDCLIGNLKIGDHKTYEKRLKRIIILALDYFLNGSYYRIPKDISLGELLNKNEIMKSALKKLEVNFMESVTLSGYSSLGNRQNTFAFSKMYFFLLWARQKAEKTFSKPDPFQEMDAKLREEMIEIFASLIWANNFVDKSEKQVIEKYIKQTGLSSSKQKELILLSSTPVGTKDIKYSLKSTIISSYMVEQLILLSLIDNQKAWEEKKLIQNISNLLGLTEKKLEQLYCSVAEFFSVHYKRLEFLKNNSNFQQFQDYMNDMILSLVKKNLDKILKEIRETKELSELLVKATTKPLTKKEKEKVQNQLLDIARSIPALAIFVMPGGGILLPILIKVLPFNILPSSFQEDKNFS